MTMSKIRFNSKTKDVRKRAKELGYSVEHTNGCHLRFTHPQLSKSIYSANTPRGQASRYNAIKDLERALKEVQP